MFDSRRFGLRQSSKGFARQGALRSVLFGYGKQVGVMFLLFVGLFLGSVSTPVALWGQEAGNGEATDAAAGVQALEGVEVVEAALDTTILPAIKDSYTASNLPGSNFGGAQHLAVGYQLSDGDIGALRTYIQFDFPGGIPAGSTINSARMRLYQYAATGLQDMRIVVQQPSGSWDEFGLSWSNQPGFLGGERASEFIDSSAGYKEWVITGLVREWKNGTSPNHGVVVEGFEEPADNRRLFYARHTSDASFRPVLIVDYTPPGTTPPPSSSFLHPVNPYQTQADFRVEWRADAPSGTAIAYYDVQVRRPGQDWQTWQSQTTATRATYTGEHGRTYEFRVRAVNQAGIAEPYPTEPQTRTTVDLVPPVVTVQSLPNHTNQSTIQVNWSGFDDVSGIRSYDVQIRYGDGAWTDAAIDTTQTSYLLTAREGVLAQARVRARDNAGNLSNYGASGANTGTTLDTTSPRACIYRFMPGYLPTVTPFSVSWLGDDWGGSGVSTFDVEYRYNHGSWVPWVSNVSFTSAGFSPTSGAGFYEFRVRARDVVGNQGQFRTSGSDGSILVGVEIPEPQYFSPHVRSSPTVDFFRAQCRRQ